MPIIGCDFHPRYQQVAVLEVSTGELVERRVEHEGSAVREFYAALPSPRRETLYVGADLCLPSAIDEGCPPSKLPLHSSRPNTRLLEPDDAQKSAPEAPSEPTPAGAEADLC